MKIFIIFLFEVTALSLKFDCTEFKNLKFEAKCIIFNQILTFHFS